MSMLGRPDSKVWPEEWSSTKISVQKPEFTEEQKGKLDLLLANFDTIIAMLDWYKRIQNL